MLTAPTRSGSTWTWRLVSSTERGSVGPLSLVRAIACGLWWVVDDVGCWCVVVTANELLI